MAEELRDIVADDRKCERFGTFLQSRFAWENFGFWLAVDQYKSSYGEGSRDAALRIYEEFVAPGAPNELGEMNFAFREQVSASLNDPSVDLFNVMQAQAFNILAQTAVKDFLQEEGVRVGAKRTNSDPTHNATKKPLRTNSSKKRARGLSIKMPNFCGKAPTGEDAPAARRASTTAWVPATKPLLADEDGLQEVLRSITAENCKQFDGEQPDTFGFLSLVQSTPVH
mmetsp:Transcript_23914/g.26544  ORF Transcript_23914/g.26544 Transcript_23914/m.26544 type:complete len:226 (-) Transcript_23914:97-774(-)